MKGVDLWHRRGREERREEQREKIENEPMGEELGFCDFEKVVIANFFKGEAMGRGERLGFGGVWVEDARKVEGEI